MDQMIPAIPHRGAACPGPCTRDGVTASPLHHGDSDDTYVSPLFITLRSTVLPVPGIALLCLLLMPQSVAAQSILFVDRDASGANTGDSWTDAYTDLQSALDDATPGDEIWVASGVYVPGGRGVQSTFELRSGVGLYGGFVGNETSRGARDWEANPTVLSGDIDDDDTSKDSTGVVTDAAGIVGLNTYQVVRALGVTEMAVLDGFFITAGNAISRAFVPPCLADCGGGLYSEESMLTVSNVTFSGNAALRYGGGMYNYRSNPTLTNVTFSGNSARDPGNSNPAWLPSGGGMYNSQSSGTLTNVTFSGNSAARHGAGMYNAQRSRPTLVDVTFSGNRAGSGGGMYNADESDATLTDVTFSGNAAGSGGGVYNLGSSPALTRVTFSGNQASGEGGGMLNNGDSSPTLNVVTFSGNRAIFSHGGGMSNTTRSSPALTNVVFSGNWAAGFGGGMYNTDESNATLTNVTFSGNTGLSGGGIWINQSNPLIYNTILWDNSAASDAGIYQDPGSSVTIRFSLVQAKTTSTDGNLDGSLDPLFLRAVDCGDDGCTDDPETADLDESANDDYGDLRLQVASSAIDAGDNDAVPVTVTSDLDGLPRIAAVKGTVAVVDMGAYERANTAPSFTSTPSTSVAQDAPYSYTATTEDETLGIRPIIAQQKPNWLSFIDNGDTTATLSGTPSSAEVGEHTVVLRALDALGASGFQTFTISVTAINRTPPGAPVLVSLETWDGEITINFTLDDDGGAPVSAYTASCSDGSRSVSVSGPRSPITVSGLENGRSYRCTVTARNALGIGPPSALSPPQAPGIEATGLSIPLLDAAIKAKK
ncbi:MAG: right-handed parallel beta-helix repeat-containing protein [Gammaproteobacteria bacterium]|jgi:hypothetical protein|nr:right-handed parallel beta-helix repeat-containing protein [Gammaproteobacteria bacterium]